MKKTLKSLGITLLVIAFWLAVWWLGAIRMGRELLLPSPHAVLTRLWELALTADFWTIVLWSILRVMLGIALALFGRFCSHLVSGTLIFDVWMPDGWGSPFVYSVAYNGAYMLPELIFTVAAVILLTKTPAFRRVLEKK